MNKVTESSGPLLSSAGPAVQPYPFAMSDWQRDSGLVFAEAAATMGAEINRCGPACLPGEARHRLLLTRINSFR
jgi:hypothetical protein